MYRIFKINTALLALIALSLCAGCCRCQFFPAEDPPPLPECPAIKYPLRVALVLGGGGAKGLAHLGVLEEFENAGIPIDMIVGCSSGSLVGALYADCPYSLYLKALLPLMRRNVLLDFNIWKARYGLCQGTSLRRFLSTHLYATTFDELKIPLYVVATDLNSGELIPIGGGPIIPAVEASCSIPLVFTPVNLHGRVLVDGGVVDPVPVRVAMQLGAQLIIAVDLGALLPKTCPQSLFGVAKRSAEIALLWQSETCLNGADYVIRPKLENIGTFQDSCNEIIYNAGKAAAHAIMPQIIERFRSMEFNQDEA